MNERIKELALEAGLVRNGDIGMKRWEGPRSDSISDQDLEKFAELIVRECALAGLETHGSYYVHDDILKYFGFGVEE